MYLEHSGKTAIRHHRRTLYQALFIAVVLALSGCSSTPKNVSNFPPNTQQTIPQVSGYALSLVGSPYRPGGSSPDQGFDCSGFIFYVFKQYGIHLPRTAQGMARQLPISLNLQAGDLVFFSTGSGSYSHVGLFIGNGRFVHAASSRTGKVLVSSLNNPYWRSHYSGARRPYHL